MCCISKYFVLILVSASKKEKTGIQIFAIRSREQHQNVLCLEHKVKM